MDYKVKKIYNMLRYKGIKCTYNYLWYQLLYAHQGWLANLLWIKGFPYTVHHPRLVEIEVTTRCPLKCPICEHTYWDEPPRDMSFEEFKMIVDQFPKLKWIGLTGIGESFVNKDFIKMLEYVKSKKIYVELYDPFFLIEEKNAGGLVKLGVDKIFVSLDAATKGTYEKIRVGAKFENVIGNIKRFLQIRDSNGSPYPELSYHYIINKLNIGEVIDFIDLVKSITGTDGSIIFTRMLHCFPETKDLFVEIPEYLEKQVKDKARETRVRVSWNADAPAKKPSISQCSLWIMPFIFVTREVIPCCAGNEANKRDSQKEYSLGNIFENSFNDIWNSDKYRDFRRMINQGKVPVQCKDCPPYSIGK